MSGGYDAGEATRGNDVESSANVDGSGGRTGERSADRGDRRIRELERENERLSELLDVLGHDLRNHLAVARGRLELARGDGDDEDLAAVARSHERMEELLEDLLAARDVGFAVGDTEPVTLSTCAESAWRNVEAGDAALVVESDLDLLADRNRLAQLLENLFRNCVEHGAPVDARDVTVTVGAVDDREGFFVEDDGRGLPPSDRERLFDEGFSTAADGTGLGLAIVGDIVEGHGWTVTAADGDSGGARFEFAGVERPAPLPAGAARE